MKTKLPHEFQAMRERIFRSISPLKPIDSETYARGDFLLSNIRAIDSKQLPEPYLIYFLLVEILDFKDLGRFEKLAWSIPVDFNGKAFLIEHRKFGVGIFVQDQEDVELAQNISILIEKAIRYAQPYYKWKAAEAIRNSQFNITNNSRELFGRYDYIRGLYKEKADEAERRKNEIVKTEFNNGFSVYCPSTKLKQEANWLAMSAIDAFFSWTEHFLVHIAIVKCSIKSGADFLEISGAEWSAKFKRSFSISDRATKKHFDSLTEVRKQQRNFLAHGAFGKNGETLLFHSAAGAVPVILDVTQEKSKFMIGEGLSFDARNAFDEIDLFIKHISTGENKIPWLYVQDWCLPTIISMASDGKYMKAMASIEDMTKFVEHLASRMDDAANMDW